MTEVRLELIEKKAHREGDRDLIDLCLEVRRLHREIFRLREEAKTVATVDGRAWQTLSERVQALEDAARR